MASDKVPMNQHYLAIALLLRLRQKYLAAKPQQLKPNKALPLIFLSFIEQDLWSSLYIRSA
jgi:hypothetical protein